MKELILASAILNITFSTFCMTESEFASLKAKAEEGDAESMCEVGRCYRNGIAVAKDDKLASEWTQKASAAGLERAKGQCYNFGYGVQKDCALAVEWYRKGAEKGDAWSMYCLAYMYKKGDGVDPSAMIAVEWFEKAAKKGNVPAMNELACYYRKGFGEIAKDDRKAFDWFLKAAEMGYAPAMYNVGREYEKGVAVDQDNKLALDWYRKAVASGTLSHKNNELAEMQIKKLEPIVKAAEKATAEAADLAEAKSKAKKFVGETLVLKSFYADMPKEDTEALCKSYLGLKRGEEISKACGYENGNLKELVLSRADIDKLFSVSGVSCEVFAKKLLEAYPIIGEFEVKTEEVPDVERQEKTKKSIEAKWQARAFGIGGGFDTGYKMGVEAAAEYDRIKDSITKFAKVYRCESKKGFLLEIHEGLTDRFLVLKKTSVINMSNFD